MENKHKLFILGLLLSLCLCGCGKTSDQKSDFEYQLLDGYEKVFSDFYNNF